MSKGVVTTVEMQPKLQEGFSFQESPDVMHVGRVGVVRYVVDALHAAS
jgi:hypothetical protein